MWIKIYEDIYGLWLLEEIRYIDGSFDDGMFGDFEGWHYLIEDGEDTTFAQSLNAYDRIIINDNLIEDVVDDGIDKSIVSGESDHYLVWVELDIN